MDAARIFPKISVLIATRNRCRILMGCLDSIMAQDYPLNRLEFVILDDASDDRTSLEIPEYLDRLKAKGLSRGIYLRNTENMFICPNRITLTENAGVDSEFLLFLDDDTVLEQGALLGMVSYISSHPEIGLIAPRVVFSDNLEQTAHCANFVDSCTGICREKDTKIPISCDWLISICCLARREALNRSGGFYSGYYTCYEEVELGLRIKKAGYRVVYYPGSKVRHLEKQMQFKRERLYYLYRNKIILVRRNFVFLNQVSSLLFVIIFGLPRYLLESIVFNRGICWTEIRLIFLAVRHGLIGKTGKLGELSQ